MNEATTSISANENVAVQGHPDRQSDPTRSPEIAGWLPVRRAAPDAPAPGSQPVTNQIPVRSRYTMLSARIVPWLAKHPDAAEVVSSVWTTLTALEQAGQHPGTLAALRFVLSHHQPPTRTGCCLTCRRHNWRHLWRRRRFPCVIWRQIRGELLGHLTSASTPPLSTEHIITQLQQLGELLPAPAGKSHD